MLLALTPNPALDRTLLIPGFRRLDVCRVAETREVASGKGLNVARVMRSLGGVVRACGPLGGPVGRRHAALAAAEGIDAAWHWLASAETRITTILVDPDSADELVINERGPLIDAHEWQQLAALIRAEARNAAMVSSSGSVPPGIIPAHFIDLLAELDAAGQPVILDTHGAALEAALERRLSLLKLNGEELGAAIGQPIDTLDAALAAASDVRRSGPRSVIVTLGAQGAILAAPAGSWVARPPSVTAISPVGSGDALLAGVAHALLANEPLDRALRMGIACGAANTLNLGSGIVQGNDVERLLPQVELEQV